MLKFRSNWLALAVGSGSLMLGLSCGSARLDPNTRAFTFDTPGLVASTAPSSQAPASSASTAPTPRDSAEPRESSGPRCSRMPDPAPSATRDWLVLNLRYEQGKLAVKSVTFEQSRKPESTVRRLGRFSAELWIGCELLDRVNFDFPLLGTDAIQATATDPHPPDFERNATFDATILLPNLERATRLEIYDRTKEPRTGLLLRQDFPLAAASSAPAKAP